MEISLNELLDRTLVVPYEEETVNRLERVCNCYVDDENNFSSDSVADLMMIVLTHSPVSSLKTGLEKLYQEKYDEMFVIPKSVCETLAAFMLILAMRKDNISYKLALLNTLIIQNGQLDKLPFAIFFAEAVQDALHYIDKEGELERRDETAFINRLFNGGKNTPVSLDEDDLHITKNLARKAWYYEIREYIEGDRLKGLQTYSKVFKSLTYIVNSMPWDFYNEHAMRQIKEITGNSNSKTKTIEDIIKIVKPLYDSQKKVKYRSSVLLQLLAGEKHEYSKLAFMKSKLTVREFAVWLYYELLHEKFYN